MKKKNWLILLTVIIIIGVIIFFVFFPKTKAKNIKIGNNSSSQEIVDYILNISSYEATVKVEVQSNKNKNQYILKQQFKNPDWSLQEVIEPSNIAGIKMIKQAKQLKIENTNLSLNSIFENYDDIANNILDLSCFIEDYKTDSKASWKEENNQIRMTTKKEQEEKTLWVDKTTGKPSKMEAKWTNKNHEIYISYNEVNINCLK